MHSCIHNKFYARALERKIIFDEENNNTNNIPENAADIISPNLQVL